MPVSVSASVLALGGTGWESVGGQLLASGVLLLSGYQDIGLRARIGSAFGFFMALAFGISPRYGCLGETLVWHRNLCCGALLRNLVDPALAASEDFGAGTWVNAAELLPSIGAKSPYRSLTGL
jgi:hypothetical protein